MAKKLKNLQLTVVAEKGTFTALFKKFSGNKSDYDFEGLAALRNLLSNEKARILHVIKTKSPSSIYSLAKMLGRDFKSVIVDIRLLERFGLIDLVSEKTGKRVRHRPIMSADSINVEIKI